MCKQVYDVMVTNHNNAHIVNYRYPEIFGSGIAVFATGSAELSMLLLFELSSEEQLKPKLNNNTIDR